MKLQETFLMPEKLLIQNEVGVNFLEVKRKKLKAAKIEMKKSFKPTVN